MTSLLASAVLQFRKQPTLAEIFAPDSSPWRALNPYPWPWLESQWPPQPLPSVPPTNCAARPPESHTGVLCRRRYPSPFPATSVRPRRPCLAPSLPRVAARPLELFPLWFAQGIDVEGITGVSPRVCREDLCRAVALDLPRKRWRRPWVRRDALSLPVASPCPRFHWFAVKLLRPPQIPRHRRYPTRTPVRNPLPLSQLSDPDPKAQIDPLSESVPAIQELPRQPALSAPVGNCHMALSQSTRVKYHLNSI